MKYRLSKHQQAKDVINKIKNNFKIDLTMEQFLEDTINELIYQDLILNNNKIKKYKISEEIRLCGNTVIFYIKSDNLFEKCIKNLRFKLWQERG